MVALVPRPRLGAGILACGAGVVLGARWYVVNLVDTGSLDGKLSEATGQTADHSVRGVLGTLRALTFDVVDASEFVGAELLLTVVVGLAMAVLGIRLTRRGAVGPSARSRRARRPSTRRLCAPRNDLPDTHGVTAGSSSVAYGSSSAPL